tara:strand:- start:38 stop:259 length:222 start_codon:yes stop_codon:yes gene_type:complete
MSKKARINLPDKDKHPKIYDVSKKSGRSSGALVKGIYGTMVTPKMNRSQVANKNKARKRQGLAPLGEDGQPQS